MGDGADGGKKSAGRKQPERRVKLDLPDYSEETGMDVLRAYLQASLALHERQQEFYDTRRDPRIRHALYAGGVGSGKTTVGAYRFLDRAIRYTSTGFILSNSYEQLEQVAVQKVMDLGRRGNLNPRIVWAHRRIDMDDIRSRIFFHSTQNFDLLRGVDMGFFWLDEARDTSLDAWRVLQGRLRDPTGPMKGDLTSTPCGIDHWLYDEFVSAGRLPGRRTVTGTSYENKHLPVSYLASLQDSYTGEFFDQEVNARFIDLAEGLCYPDFRREIHAAGAIAQVPGEPVHVGIDFNVNPMTAVFAHVEDRRTIRVFASWSERNSNTGSLIVRIRRLAGDGTDVTVYPDASGRNRHTSGGTDFALLEEAGFRIDAPPANPLQMDRIETVNRAFRDGRIFISGTAKELIQSLVRTKWQEGRRSIDKGTNMEHLSDALGYLVWQLAPVRGRGTRAVAERL